MIWIFGHAFHFILEQLYLITRLKDIHIISPSDVPQKRFCNKHLYCLPWPPSTIKRHSRSIRNIFSFKVIDGLQNRTFWHNCIWEFSQMSAGQPKTASIRSNLHFRIVFDVFICIAFHEESWWNRESNIEWVHSWSETETFGNYVHNILIISVLENYIHGIVHRLNLV